MELCRQKETVKIESYVVIEIEEKAKQLVSRFKISSVFGIRLNYFLFIF